MADHHPMSFRPSAHEDEGIYRETLDGLLEGFQIIGFDWRYLYVNPAAARHGRQAPDELIGRRMHEVYPGIEQTPLFAVLRTCMREREPASFENCFTYPDQTTRWFEIRVEPVPQGLCVQSADIQDRKDAQAKADRLIAELRLELSARAEELEAMRQRVEKLEAMER
jgi:PAS domain S-box-containing protein